MSAGTKLDCCVQCASQPDAAAAQRIISDALPPLLASLMPSEQLELLRRRLRELPEPTDPVRLTRRDALGAAGIFLLAFLCTFPVVIPLFFIADPGLALHVSNAVAIAMLFLCGHGFGRHAGVWPWASGLAMVAIGAALAGVASVLGG
jgi:VIT1/CCC1 family predicted Fe2+/Mn2+ transporter